MWSTICSRPDARLSRDSIPAGLTPERLRAAAWWVLLAGVALATVATANLSALGLDTALLYGSFVLPKFFTLAIAGALSSLLWVFSLHGDPIARRHPAIWAVAALCAWAAVSAAVSVQPAKAFFGSYERLDGLLTEVLLAVLFLLAMQLVRPDSLRSGAIAVAAVGIVSALYGLAQVAGLDPFEWSVERWMLPFSFLGNRDFLGGLLVMPLALIPFLAVTSRRRWARVVWWLAGGVIAACVVVTLVRGAWIAAALGLLVALVVLWRTGAGPRLIDWLSLGAIGLIVVAVALFGGPGWGMEFGVLERLASITQFGSGSIATRVESWEVALRVVGWRPLTGTGPANFAVAWTRFATPAYLVVDPTGGVADNAHSYPLQVVATLGVPGLLAALAAVVLALWGRAAQAVESDEGGGHTIRRGLMVAALAYGVFLLAGFNSIETMALWWVVLGMLAGTSMTAREVRLGPLGPLVAWLLVAAALVVFGLGAMWVRADRLAARYSFGQGRESAVLGLDLAARAAPWAEHYRLNRAYLLDSAAREHLAAARLQPDAAVLQAAASAVASADAAYAHTARVAPTEYVNFLMWSRLLNRSRTLLGQEMAQHAYDVASRAVQIHPTSVEVRVHKAEAALQLGRPEEAAELLKDAWKWSAGQEGPAVLYIKALGAFDEPAARSAAAEAMRRFPDSEQLRSALEATGSVLP